MSKNLYYNELNTKQIYLEILKRFPKVEYSDDLLTIIDLFGEEWLLLDEYNRDIAEQWFINVIRDTYLKGIFYKLSKNGDNLYVRIPNDIFKK